MSHPFRAALARLTLHFSPERSRWVTHWERCLPILENTLPGDPHAQLLTMRFLDDLSASRYTHAQKKLELLRRIIREGGNQPDRALYCVLKGMYHAQLNQPYEMARCMRQASKHGHRYHLPYLLLGIHYLFDRCRYDQAYAAFNAAISCIYEFPPLDEGKRQLIARLQCSMALASTMMHDQPAAEALLIKAAPAEKSVEYQHASAVLRAVQGRRMEAEHALHLLAKADPQRHEHFAPGIRMMLEGAHPHFNALQPDTEAIAAYWEWFASEERTLRRILSEEGGNACWAYQNAAFSPLEPVPESIDMMGIGFRMVQGQPELNFYAYYSRTYAVLVDALAAACPEKVREHWHVAGFHTTPPIKPIHIPPRSSLTSKEVSPHA